MTTDTDFIIASLKTNLEDLYILFTNDKTRLDLQCFVELSSILMRAEAAAIKSIEDHTARRKAVQKSLGRLRS